MCVCIVLRTLFGVAKSMFQVTSLNTSTPRNMSFMFALKWKLVHGINNYALLSYTFLLLGGEGRNNNWDVTLFNEFLILMFRFTCVNMLLMPCGTRLGTRSDFRSCITLVFENCNKLNRVQKSPPI